MQPRGVRSGDRHRGRTEVGGPAAQDGVADRRGLLVGLAEGDGAGLGQPRVLLGAQLDVERREVVLQLARGRAGR